MHTFLFKDALLVLIESAYCNIHKINQV